MATITVLDASPKVLTKQFWPNGRKLDYEEAFWFDYVPAEVGDLADLAELLMILEGDPHSCLIRGEINEGIGPGRVLRRKDAYDGYPAFFRENPAGVQWCMADFDKIPAPDDLHPDDRITYLVSLLPEYLWDVSFFYQWSSSAGTRGWETLSCHLWFWLEQPRTDTEMIRWAESTGVLDEAVMRIVQPNYIARPIFHDGMPDPMGSDRSGIVLCRHLTAPIPVVKPKPQPTWTTSGSGAWSGSASPWAKSGSTTTAAFERRIEEIGPRLHMPIQKAIASYVSTGGRDFLYLKTRIRDRLAVCPKAGQDPTIYLRDRYLDQSIRGALRKFGR